MKVCSKCGNEKSLTEFNKRLETKDKLRSECKECQSILNKARYIANADQRREKQREWNAANKDKKKKSSRDWYLQNIEKVREARERWEEANPEKARECHAKAQVKYRIIHREEINKKSRERRLLNPDVFKERCKASRQKHLIQRRAKDRKTSSIIRGTIKGTLDDRMSAGIRAALKKNKTGQSWEKIVGYTVDELKHHLEERFTQGMTWELLMQGKVHIDHKIPKSVFNYNTVTDIDFKRCWALENLQPLWATENLSKKDYLSEPFQPSLAMSI